MAARVDANVRRGHFRDASQTETTVASAFEMQGSFSKTIFFLYFFWSPEKGIILLERRIRCSNKQKFCSSFFISFFSMKKKKTNVSGTCSFYFIVKRGIIFLEAWIYCLNERNFCYLFFSGKKVFIWNLFFYMGRVLSFCVEECCR